jgi:hypothetical protein
MPDVQAAAKKARYYPAINWRINACEKCGATVHSGFRENGKGRLCSSCWAAEIDRVVVSRHKDIKR